MFPYTRAAILTFVLFTVSACTTFNSGDSDKAPYYESSFNDRNRAPASFAPASVAPDADSTAAIDPLYMRTQADYYFAMGEAYSLEGNSAKALEAFKSTLIYDQESPAVHMRLAAEYLKQGLLSEALVQGEEASKKDPKNIDAHILLGGLYSSMKIYPKALDQYNMVMKMDPKNTEAPLYLGALYSEQKQPEKAVKFFEDLAKNSDYPSPHLAWYYIGRVRMEQPGPKYQKAAEEALKKSLSIKPEFVDALLSLGAMYTRDKNEAKAIAMYREYQKENTPSAKVAELLAQTYIEQGDYEKAYDQLEIIERESEESLNVRMKMALILIDQKKFDKAADKLQMILKEAPDSDKVRFYLAAVYEESHKPELAIQEYKKVPVSSNFYGESVVHRAYILKSLGRLDEALDTASEGLKNRQDQPQIFAMYASLLDEKSDYKTASSVLEQGLVKFPENAQLRFYYGTIQDRLGDKEAVVKEMKRVLEIDPNHVQGMNYLAFTWAEMGKDLHEAEKLARRASELEPKDGYVLDTLGWVLYKQNKIGEAIKVLETAHKFQGTVSVIAEHLGDAYYKQALVEKAKLMYRKAVDLETDKQKAKEIRAKLTAIEKQELSTPRMPASINPMAEQGR